MIFTADTRALTLTGPGIDAPCVIGRGGACAAAAKREGDGCTPLGVWPVRTVLFRPDRLPGAVTTLPWRWLRAGDGWCDDPADPDYNRPVVHPFRRSAERLWRDDPVYDAVVTLGHNDTPVVPGMGSAIFLHATSPDRRLTEGCVAIDLPVLLDIVRIAAPGARLEIV